MDFRRVSRGTHSRVCDWTLGLRVKETGYLLAGVKMFTYHKHGQSFVHVCLSMIERAHKHR